MKTFSIHYCIVNANVRLGCYMHRLPRFTTKYANTWMSSWKPSSHSSLSFFLCCSSNLQSYTCRH